MEALTYDRLRDEMAPLDGYSRVPLGHRQHPEFIATDGGGIEIRIPHDPTDAETDYESYVVTKELWADVAKDLRAGQGYFDSTPPRLLLPHLNYWYGNAEASKGEVELLVRRAPQGHTLGLGILKPGRHPVSATRLLETVHESVRDLGGSEPSYAFYQRNGIREATFAAVARNYTHEVSRSRRVGDILEGGVMVTFSPIGSRPVTVSSYINALVCTNGMTSTRSLDAWSAPGGEGSNDPYEWVPRAVSAAWDGVESLFTSADSMAEREVPEDAIETILEDTFAHYRTPRNLQAAVFRQLVNTNVFNLWDVQNAITAAATHDEQLRSINDRIRLMALGGDMPEHSERCDTCNHLITRAH